MILYDVTVTLNAGLNTGIQRVVKSIAQADNDQFFTLVYGNQRGPLKIYGVGHDDLLSPPSDRTLANLPLNLTRTFFQRYRGFLNCFIHYIPGASYLRDFALLSLSPNAKLIKALPDGASIAYGPGDIYITFDAFWNSKRDTERIQSLHNSGVKIIIFLHDVIPLKHPELFERASVEKFKKNFSLGVEVASGVLFSSRAVASDFAEFFKEVPSYTIIPLGSVFSTNTLPVSTIGEPLNIIMLGTIEPRKNYLEILDWYSEAKIDNPLVIVGRLGWNSKEIVRKIVLMQRQGLKVSWLANVNDDELNSLISKSKIGICASLDEGFGLPLREFLSSGLLVVASDIPAFREVSSKNVSYFELSNLDSLDRAVRKSLNTTFSPEAHPTRAWSEVFVEVKNFINSL